MNLQPIDQEQLKPLQSQAARDHVSLAPCKSPVKWYGVFDTSDPALNVLVGVCGLMDMKSGVKRIKGVWVRPDSRAQGIGRFMVDELIALCRTDVAVTAIEVYAYNSDYYRGLGFKEMGRPLPNGAVRLRRVM